MSTFIVTILDDVEPGSREWQWCDLKKIASVPSARNFTKELAVGQQFTGTIRTLWFIVFSESQKKFCAIINQTYVSSDLTKTNYQHLLEKMEADIRRES